MKSMSRSERIKYGIVVILVLACFLIPTTEVFTMQAKMFMAVTVFGLAISAFELLPMTFVAMVMPALWAILGVADVNYDAAEKFANRHRIRPYPDVPALLADKAVDVVCICTPSGYHADVVRQAAEAGKHIVVEKPMAITKAQLDDIVACCETNGVMLTSIAQ